MARLLVQDGAVVVRLNMLERLAAGRWRAPCVPLDAVTLASTLERSDPSTTQDLVRMGFAAAGAPLAGLATVGPHARTEQGHRAFIVTYRSGPAVVVHCNSAALWGLLLVSSRRPVDVAQDISSAVQRLRDNLAAAGE